MNKLKSFSKRFLKTVKNNKGQGMVEYILMLVVVVAIVFIMKDKLKTYVSEDMFGQLTQQINGTMGN